jgi:hypothetical protein
MRTTRSAGSRLRPAHKGETAWPHAELTTFTPRVIPVHVATCRHGIYIKSLLQRSINCDCDCGAGGRNTVTDGTGSLAGWHVTTSATTFTNGTATLPNTGTFVTTGSSSSITATIYDTAALTGVGQVVIGTVANPVGCRSPSRTPWRRGAGLTVVIVRR